MAHPAPEEQFHRQRVRTAFVSVTVSMALVLFVVGVMASLLLQARELGRELQENFTFTAFLVPETDAATVRQLQQKYGGVAVLKGNGSLIADGDQLLLSDYGNPGMASGGMGDVLSGVIGSLLAQHLPPLEAAALGVCLHGAAADIAAGDGQRGLLASDLAPHMRAMLG